MLYISYDSEQIWHVGNQMVIVSLFFFRPVLVIGGSSDVDQESMGAFQEFPQVLNCIIL